MEFLKLESRLQGEISITSDIHFIFHADNTTLMTGSEEEVKSLLMKVKEESDKAGLNSTLKKTKVVASSSITPWQRDGETVETGRLQFLGLQNHCRW